MPSTITMPTSVFLLIIFLIIWIVFRDDFKKSKPLSYRKRVVHNDCDMVEVLIKAEEEQFYEFN
jgi:hypothetical protein